MVDVPSVTKGDELQRRYAAGERRFLGINLSVADLGWANLMGANLAGANLKHATLFSADLKCMNLLGANLQGANLANADLKDATLRHTALTGANLMGANLTGANLTGANLTRAGIGRVKLAGAILGETLLVGINLTSFCEARSTIVHVAPSTIDYASIVLSAHAVGLEEFLAQTGMPEVFVEYLTSCAKSLRMDVFKMLQSTFISYGSPDEAFARKLYESLHRNGVSTFFFPEHAVPGEKMHDVMRRVNDYDRVVLVCSTNSLNRKGVANEIEHILAREARDGGATYLIPITLDNYVFHGWNPPKPGTALEVRDRVVADFRGTETDDTKFQAALLRLIAALRK